MATTQTNKRRAAATKRSTTAKKAAGTRARRTAAQNASRAKTSAKRRANQPTGKQVRPLAAQAEFVGAVVGNAVQTGVTAGSKAAAAVTRRIAKLV
jgi:hypothetical protein